ncbi:hypothetical Protein psc5_06690 [Candidatus Phytoplasma solani]
MLAVFKNLFTVAWVGFVDSACVTVIVSVVGFVKLLNAFSGTFLK